MNPFAYSEMQCPDSRNFKYENFIWYLGKAGDSCDTTCENFEYVNAANDAANIIKQDDCTVMNQFLNQSKTILASKSNTSFWTFGYFYDSYSKYVCTSYGNHVSAGAGPGHTNADSDRRIVCPCRKGN